jgi:MFS family permease
MLSGLGAGNIGTAQAIIADSTPPEHRAKGMGLIGAAFGLGFIFGPAIGGSFAQFGLTVPVFIAAGLAALNGILAYFILPETRFLHPEAPAEAPANPHRTLSWAALKHAARHPGVSRIFSLYFYYAVAFSMMEQVLALFVLDAWVSKMNLAQEAADKKAAFMTMQLLVVVGVTATIVQGGLIGRLVKKFGEKRLLAFGMALVALTLLALPGTEHLSFTALLLLMIPMAFGTGVMNPSISSLLSRSVDKDEQGGTLGIGQGLSALGRVVGPSMAGLFYDIHMGMPFWVGGGLMVLSTALCLTVKQKH